MRTSATPPLCVAHEGVPLPSVTVPAAAGLTPAASLQHLRVQAEGQWA